MINIVQGIVIGVVNIIPGISGGTALVFLGIFDKTMKSISNIIKLEHIANKKDDLLFLIKIAIGFLIGVIIFAKTIDYLFINYFIQTMYWFIGLIVFSLPIIIKNEMKDIKFSKLYFFLGLCIVSLTYLFNINQEPNFIITNFPDIKFIFLLKLILLGTMAGIMTIIPGVSGSMFLLILGQYSLMQSYIAESTSLRLTILIPLVFFGIGTLLGILIGAKIISYFISKYKSNTMSLIIGLIIMSSIVLIPINFQYNFNLIISSLFSFLFGGMIIVTIEIAKKLFKK